LGVTLIATDGVMADESENAIQRRLWFLQLLLEKMDAEKALDLAARMEAFVATDGPATLPKEDHRHPAAQNAPTKLPAAQTGNMARSLDESSAAERPPPAMTRDGAGRLLSDGETQAFMTRAVRGATNRELARVFGLTPRQANGIRMALAKRNPQVALRSGLDA
jgi:hypothetical protein